MSQKLTQNFLKNKGKSFEKIKPKTESREEVEKPIVVQKFRTYLDENGEIHLDFIEKDNMISLKYANAIRLELYKVIGEKMKFDGEK